MKMTKNRLVLIFLLIFSLNIKPTFAGPSGTVKNGYIQNDMGERCVFTQVVKEKNSYFRGTFQETMG